MQHERQTLEQRARQTLARMSALAAATSGSVIAFNPNGAHASRIPAGVRTTLDASRLDPNEPRTLHDTWAARFAQVDSTTDLRELYCLVLAAEAALDTVTHRRPGRLVDEHDDPSAATEERCLAWYEGLEPEVAATIEAAAYGGSLRSLTLWIERLRIRNDRDPKNGHPRLSGDGRLRRVAELRAQGLGARRIARDLGCALSTAQAVIRQIEEQPERRRAS